MSHALYRPNQVGAANTFTRQYSSQYGSLARYVSITNEVVHTYIHLCDIAMTCMDSFSEAY